MSVTALRPSHPIPLDDEIAALAFQLEELGLQSESSKGKHPIDRPSNFEVVFAAFQAELEEYQAFLADQKLAQSIGAAVHSDGAVIGDLTAQEIQSHEDHRFVLQLSNDDPEIEAPPGTVDHHVQGNVDDWMSTVAETVAAYSVVDFSDDETEAGPSMTYAERQADTIKKMSMEFQCVACTDRYARTSMVTTKCGHRYCAGCAKSLFMRSTKDEGLFPPKCCKQPIPLPLVAKHMDVDELAVFELASVEFATQHRIYCSNLDCSVSVAPNSATYVVQIGRTATVQQPISTAQKSAQKRLWREMHHRTFPRSRDWSASARYLRSSKTTTSANILGTFGASPGTDLGEAFGVRCAMLVTTSTFCSAAIAT
ncbi:hypothetical protein HBI56_033900 [Parastagonospora nodorum]|nr:hypothetical protein HBI10_012720 [Parastagonospora nodorum]KAH4011462.1 hypothetical protein HBI13_197870 [Parastagonospora nodorum]KAH4034615.1 hypothetical protein HBI09_101130 [Parastagonospora nodorum]KAH4176898.1 hypothetical protein HBH43_045270 [Parastagonospora nodorum]KAH4343404.1 hypothetical protein HBH98_149410 [Parastagonospora nodorum]